MIYQFWITFAILLFAVVFFDKTNCMLRDISKASGHQPYSWARVQLAWWTVIVLSSFIAILWGKGIAPTLNSSTVILLGISAATTATARVIDISDREKYIRTHQDSFGKNFFLDILSDQNGVSVHRFQTIVFNAVFGVWFIHAVLNNLVVDCSSYLGDAELLKACKEDAINYIMPPITNNNLILLGLSSATYAAMKITENSSAKTPAALSDNIAEEPSESSAEADSDPAVG